MISINQLTDRTADSPFFHLYVDWKECVAVLRVLGYGDHDIGRILRSDHTWRAAYLSPKPMGQATAQDLKSYAQKYLDLRAMEALVQAL